MSQTPAKKKSAAMSQEKPTLEQQRSALIDEFNSLIADAESLLKHTAEYAGEGSDELRRKLSDNIENARALLQQGGLNLQERSRAAVETTEQYVKDHPLQSLGIAAGVGLILGLLISRR